MKLINKIKTIATLIGLFTVTSVMSQSIIFKVPELQVSDAFTLNGTEVTSIEGEGNSLMTRSFADDRFATKTSDGRYSYISDLSSITVTPPIDQGRVRWNNAVHASANQLYISNSTLNGYNINNEISNLSAGSSIRIADRDDVSKGYIYTVNSTSSTGSLPSDYVIVNVSYRGVGSGGVISVSDTAGLDFYTFGNASGGGGTSDSIFQYAQIIDSAKFDFVVQAGDIVVTSDSGSGGLLNSSLMLPTEEVPVRYTQYTPTVTPTTIETGAWAIYYDQASSTWRATDGVTVIQFTTTIVP